MTSEPITIRPATADDVDRVVALVARLLEELAGAGGVCPGLADLTAAARRLFEAGGYDALLALDPQDRPVAVLTLNECGAIYALGRFGEIAEFYVAPGLRSSGLGARMVAAALEQARARGWTRLEVGAPDVPRWQRTVDFYRRCGFIEVGPRLRLPLI
jgi:GNAT superfamily N-acetyltransferase